MALTQEDVDFFSATWVEAIENLRERGWDREKLEAADLERYWEELTMAYEEVMAQRAARAVGGDLVSIEDV